MLFSENLPSQLFDVSALGKKKQKKPINTTVTFSKDFLRGQKKNKKLTGIRTGVVEDQKLPNMLNIWTALVFGALTIIAVTFLRTTIFRLTHI